MSIWKILTDPGGAEGCRSSVESAVKLNIKRAREGSPFSRRGVAVSTALANRYRVVRRPFDPDTIIFEAAPLAWLDEQRVPRIVAEYVIDQEHPKATQAWLADMMPDLLQEFVTTPNDEVLGAVGGMFLGFSMDRFMPHWVKWLRPETLEAIHDIGKAHWLASCAPPTQNDDAN